MKPAAGRRPVLSALVAPLVLAVAVGVYFTVEGGGPATVADEPTNPCFDGAETHRAAFLLDLRKPLDPGHAGLPGALFRQAATEMAPGTDLTVYALSPHAEAPRTLVGRVCKTVDLDDLVTETAKHGATDDCDVPAQAPVALRAAARDFCRQRDALARRVDALVVESLGQAAGAAYLVEALEATAREFGETPGTLHVFSDMQQHAPWFSHAEQPAAEWDYARMAAAWIEQPMVEQLRGLPSGTMVRIHYVPRAGSTEDEDGRVFHQRFWERYFADAEVAFEDQPTMAEYVPASLAEAPTAMELAAYELERLRHSSARMERDREAIAQDRQDLENARRELDRERERLAAERREFAAERERLEAEVRNPAAADGVRLAAGEGSPAASVGPDAGT